MCKIMTTLANEICKNCKNCKYYIQHYVKRRSRYIKIACAHCSNAQISCKVLKRFPLEDGRDKWVCVELTTEEELLTAVKSQLKAISNKLDELVSALSDENYK